MIASLSLEAFDGRIEPFMDCLHQIRPHKGQIETGEAFRHFLEGSEIIAQPKAHVQDPYSFRCIPQVHGATKDPIRYVASVLLTEINSVTDNPTIFRVFFSFFFKIGHQGIVLLTRPKNNDYFSPLFSFDKKHISFSAHLIPSNAVCFYKF